MLNSIINYIKDFGRWIKSFFTSSERKLSAKSVTIPYLMNDPTTPRLVKHVVPPRAPKKLNFQVVGYNGGAVELGTPQALAANCFVTLATCVNYMDKMISENRTPLSRWATTRSLRVVPKAGKMFNAYYDRTGLKFFYDVDPKTKKMVYTAESSDIVAHEMGHALLDALRPDFWSVQALEIWSFHEAFADITAMLSIMQHGEIMRRAVGQTGGNLRKPNIISNLAEEMGNAILHTHGPGAVRVPGALRSAINRFKYTRPEILPQNAPANKIAAECHSFGRIFMGAWYDILVGIYEKEVQKGRRKVPALQIARDIAAHYITKAAQISPRVNRYFEATARSMLLIDKAEGSPHKDILETVFRERRLWRPKIKHLSHTNLKVVEASLKRKDSIVKFGDSTYIHCPENKTTTLAVLAKDMGIKSFGILSHGEHNLSEVELEIPNDTYYEFDGNTLVNEVHPDNDEILQVAHACILTIQAAGPLDENSMWNVKKGKLVRNFIE